MAVYAPRNVIHQKFAEMQFARAEWLEDVIAGLITAGCSQEDIEIRESQVDSLRTIVTVCGVPKYEWYGKFTINDSLSGHGGSGRHTGLKIRRRKS